MTRLGGINHVALEVGDVEEALAFYGRLFEFTPGAVATARGEHLKPLGRRDHRPSHAYPGQAREARRGAECQGF